MTLLQPELAALQRALPEITGVGASLAVISPQVARTPRETQEAEAFAYAMLRDFGNRVAELGLKSVRGQLTPEETQELERFLQTPTAPPG